MLWLVPVIPGTWEVEVGRLQTEAGLGKNKRLYLKKIAETKRVGGMWLKW